MHCLRNPAQPGQVAPTLLVLLPPAQASAEDFVAQGFVAAVRRRGLPVDICAASLGYEHLLAGTAVDALQQRVVAPALAATPRRIWLAGISMGAFHALFHAVDHAASLAGIELIAPYPGTGGVLAEINAAGGPLAWHHQHADARADERSWWHWLAEQSATGRQDLPVHASLAAGDRFIQGQRLLAGLLPGPRVREMDGAHDWDAWRRLWEDWLDHGPLARAAA